MGRPGRRRPTPRRDRHLRAVGEPPLRGAAGEVVADAARALADPEPLALLLLASSLVSALDPRTADPLGDTTDDEPDAAAFVDTLVDHPSPETTALLLALAVLLPDNYLAQRARAAARRREHPVPEWLARLEEAEPGTALASTDVLGDGENVVVSVHLPGGRPVTAVVYVDHNVGTVVKDAYVVAEEPEQYRERFLALAPDPVGLAIGDIEPAEAGARIVQAIEVGSALGQRFTTDTWPACRPIVEWMVGGLPASGIGYLWPDWTEAQRCLLAADFMRAPQAVDLTGADDGKIVLDLLRFTTDFSGGDPLRWSHVNVEILLRDWYPRMVTAGEDYLRRMPTVLRALVEHSHRHKDVPAPLTVRTLGAVDEWEPVYLEVLGLGTRPTVAPVEEVPGLPGE